MQVRLVLLLIRYLFINLKLKKLYNSHENILSNFMELMLEKINDILE